MGAREFFCAARDAAARMRDYEGRMEAKRQLAVMRARSEGPSGRGGVTDPTRRIDDYVDLEASHARGSASDARLVADAKLLLASYSEVDPGGARVLWLRYISLAPWADICARLGLPYGDARTMEQVAFDRIDSDGLAATAAGRRDVTGAEDR